MITKTHLNLNGISYWSTTGDDEDKVINCVTSYASVLLDQSCDSLAGKAHPADSPEARRKSSVRYYL